MKIVHITYMLTFGGIETMLVNIANEQVRNGHKVSIIVIERNAVNSSLVNKLDASVKLYFAERRKNTKDLLALFRINAFLLGIRPDVIHMHVAGIMRFILLPGMRKICNSTLHAIPDSKNTIAITTVPRVFAISNAVADCLLNNYGVHSIVNPNGIPCECFKVKRTYSNNFVKIVQVSRLEHLKKGQHLLLEASSILRKRGYNNFNLTFIGDGESLDYLKQKSTDLGLSDIVDFMGSKPQDYIFEHLCEYDLFIQPSIYEGFGLTVAEAMAAKVPVIVSSGQGPEEIINYGEYGCVFENGNVNDCAAKIEVFLKGENDKQQIEAAYQRVLQNYDIKATVFNYLKNYLHR